MKLVATFRMIRDKTLATDWVTRRREQQRNNNAIEGKQSITRVEEAVHTVTTCAYLAQAEDSTATKNAMAALTDGLSDDEEYCLHAFRLQGCPA